MVDNEGEEDHNLPTAIVVTDVPSELFDRSDLKKNFSDLFIQIDPSVQIDFLKSFRRVRVVFSSPENATAAKLTVEHHEFEGVQMKTFFVRNITVKKRAYQDEGGHLTLPPLEKQFLISPPSSPPVGWEQCREMAPVICDFDLMARLASYTIEDDYEVHGGEEGQPRIVVTPVKNEDDDSLASEPEGERMRCPPTPLPHTPRPPSP